ncbi:MAG: glycosyltransferase family 2 protein [Anaerolineales bacterium]
MPALVSVVVVNWNGCAHLQKCLTALARQTYAPVEICVVDNGSTDDSVAWTRAHFPAVQLIQNANNVGFAAANNQGLRQTRGEFVALLNNDAWPEPDWLAQLVAALERQPRVGMAASKMLFAHAPQVINSTGIGLDRAGIAWDRDGGRLDVDVRDGNEVFGPCAGAALYRRTLFDQVGEFDESFFAYLEDVDLAWRARWLGWEATYEPTARVYHVHSGTALEGSPLKTYWLSRNKLCLLTKNYPTLPLWRWFPLILFYEILSQGYAFLNGRGWPALRGRLAGLRRLPECLRQRRQLRQRATVTDAAIVAQLQPAVWPWQVTARYQHLRREGP